MAHSLSIECRDVMEEVYLLLQTLDPARWRDELEETTRANIARISARLRELLEAHEVPRGDERLQTLCDRLKAVSQLIDEHRARRGAVSPPIATDWASLRSRLHPLYANVAASLHRQAIEIPPVRPTNWKRSVAHVCFAGCIFICIQFVFSETMLIVVAGLFAAWAWSMEILRRRSDEANERLMRFFRHVAHPHEVHRINSATWYSSAMLILALFSTPLASSVGVMILGIADPAAAAVGRRYGRWKVVGERSWAGSITFFLVALVLGAAILTFFGPSISLSHLWIVVGIVALFGTLSELFSFSLDDNFTIPLASAFALLASMALLLG